MNKIINLENEIALKRRSNYRGITSNFDMNHCFSQTFKPVTLILGIRTNTKKGVTTFGFYSK
jgi:hypothetical protein